MPQCHTIIITTARLHEINRVKQIANQFVFASVSRSLSVPLVNLGRWIRVLGLFGTALLFSLPRRMTTVHGENLPCIVWKNFLQIQFEKHAHCTLCTALTVKWNRARQRFESARPNPIRWRSVAIGIDLACCMQTVRHCRPAKSFPFASPKPAPALQLSRPPAMHLICLSDEG